MSQLIYKFYGGVAERFRHGFAKPRTRVRIPSPPPQYLFEAHAKRDASSDRSSLTHLNVFIRSTRKA